MKNTQLTIEDAWYINKSNRKCTQDRECLTETRPTLTDVTYAQTARGHTEPPQTKVPQLHTTNTTHPTLTKVTYAQMTRGHIEQPQTNIPQPHKTKMTNPANELAELKQTMKNLLDQMGTRINLITAHFSKNNK